jgi:hypothetical protein
VGQHDAASNSSSRHRGLGIAPDTTFGQGGHIEGSARRATPLCSRSHASFRRGCDCHHGTTINCRLSNINCRLSTGDDGNHSFWKRPQGGGVSSLGTSHRRPVRARLFSFALSALPGLVQAGRLDLTQYPLVGVGRRPDAGLNLDAPMRSERRKDLEQLRRISATARAHPRPAFAPASGSVDCVVIEATLASANMPSTLLVNAVDNRVNGACTA